MSSFTTLTNEQKQQNLDRETQRVGKLEQAMQFGKESMSQTVAPKYGGTTWPMSVWFTDTTQKDSNVVEIVGVTGYVDLFNPSYLGPKPQALYKHLPVVATHTIFCRKDLVSSNYIFLGGIQNPHYSGFKHSDQTNSKIHPTEVIFGGYIKEANRMEDMITSCFHNAASELEFGNKFHVLHDYIHQQVVEKKAANVTMLITPNFVKGSSTGRQVYLIVEFLDDNSASAFFQFVAKNYSSVPVLLSQPSDVMSSNVGACNTSTAIREGIQSKQIIFQSLQEEEQKLRSNKFLSVTWIRPTCLAPEDKKNDGQVTHDVFRNNQNIVISNLKGALGIINLTESSRKNK